jgi:hypothetical protein
MKGGKAVDHSNMKSVTWLTTLLSLVLISPGYAQISFTRMSDGPISTDIERSWGCALGDYDNDGLVDVFVATAWGSKSCLYHNEGEFRFGKVTAEPVVQAPGDSCTGVFADSDNDGDLDLFVTGFDPYKSAFFSNDYHPDSGNQSLFIPITSGSWINVVAASVGAAWADYDSDGFVDLFVANTSNQDNFLYRNDGIGGMSAMTDGPVVSSGGQSQGCTWGDYDGDGDLDLFVANSFGQTNFLFRNEGAGSFSRITEPPFDEARPHWLGAAWADCDNDGDLDLFVAHGVAANSALYQNNGDDMFTPLDDVATSFGTSLGAVWGDFDNDGYLDLFAPRGRGLSDLLFHNERDGTFTQVYEGAIVNDKASAIGSGCADFDNDGYLDMFVSNGPEDAASPGEANFLYRNDARASGNTNAWLLVRLIGTLSNRSAIGAKVRIQATVWDAELWQLREISGGSGHCSQNDLRAHFGLGDAAQVDLLRIEWPSGIVQEIVNVPANQVLTVTEPPRLVPQGIGAFQIQCWINQRFAVQASSDLTTWSTVAIVTNTTGTLVFQDAVAGQHECRYYRVSEYLRG